MVNGRTQGMHSMCRCVLYECMSDAGPGMDCMHRACKEMLVCTGYEQLAGLHVWACTACVGEQECQEGGVAEPRVCTACTGHAQHV